MPAMKRTTRCRACCARIAGNNDRAIRLHTPSDRGWRLPVDRDRAIADAGASVGWMGSSGMKTTAALATVLSLGLALSAQGRRTVIAVGALIDGKGAVIRNTRIVVEGRTIARIDPNASPIDYDLRTAAMMPGWIDTHVHINWHFDANGKSVSSGDPSAESALATADDAWATLQGGVTTVQSVGSAVDGAVRDHINRGLLPGPRILTSLRSRR